MTTADIRSDVEPSDYMIQILVSPIFGASAVARKGSAICDLGEVDLELSDMWKLRAQSSMNPLIDQCHAFTRTLHRAFGEQILVLEHDGLKSEIRQTHPLQRGESGCAIRSIHDALNGGGIPRTLIACHVRDARVRLPFFSDSTSS